MSHRPFVDFYVVLGVDPLASPKEISAAYVSLAYKHHPDSSGSEDPSTSEFKAVVEAYETLSDPQKRRDYDRKRQSRQSSARQVAVGPARPTGTPFSSKGVFPPLDEVADAPSVRQPIQSDPVVELRITPEEARWGTSLSLTLTRCGACPACRGGGCSACDGRGQVSRQRPLHVRVPPSVCDGTLLHMPGDCVLHIRIRPCV